MNQKTQMIVGFNPAVPGGDRMVFTCLKKREETFPPFILSDWHIGGFNVVPEGCLDVWEEKKE